MRKNWIIICLIRQRFNVRPFLKLVDLIWVNSFCTCAKRNILLSINWPYLNSNFSSTIILQNFSYSNVSSRVSNRFYHVTYLHDLFCGYLNILHINQLKNMQVLTLELKIIIFYSLTIFNIRELSRTLSLLLYK